MAKNYKWTITGVDEENMEKIQKQPENKTLTPILTPVDFH